MDWFRWHHGTVNDPKWRLVARRAKASVGEVIAVWACILETASQAETRGNAKGVSSELIGISLDMDEERVTSILEAMQGVVMAGDQLTGWEKRQPKRERDQDVSTNRVRAFRERKRNETPCNAASRAETPREDKIREEKNPPIAPQGGLGDDWIDSLGPAESILRTIWRQSGTQEDRCRQWLVTTKGPGRDKVNSWLALGLSVGDITTKIAAVFDEAEHRGQPIKQPFPYLDTVIRAMAAERQNQRQAAAAGGVDWPGRVRGFHNRGIWLDTWGPAPGEPGCRVPADVAAQ